MKRGHVPVRTCRSCRAKGPKNTLRRYIVEQGRLVEKYQDGGYGFYCCPNTVCSNKLQQKLLKQQTGRAKKIRGRE